MTNHKVKCANFEIANDRPFTLIAGPCQLESEQHALDISKELKQIASELKINLIYKTNLIHERHRHRYEVNKKFKSKLEKKGLIFSGLSPDGSLTETIELENHPWFIGVQFHPEFKSRPFEPHPLFSSFIKAAKSNSKNTDD